MVKCDKCGIQDIAEIRYVSVFFNPPFCKAKYTHIELGAVGWLSISGVHFCPRCSGKVSDLVKQYVNKIES